MKCFYISDFSLTGSEFHRVGAATEKGLVPTFVLILGIKNRLELDNQSCVGSLAGVSSVYMLVAWIKKLDRSLYRS